MNKEVIKTGYVQLANFVGIDEEKLLGKIGEFNIYSDTKVGAVFNSPKELVDYLKTYGYNHNDRVKYYKIMEIIPTLKDEVKE